MFGKIAWAESHVGTAFIYDRCVLDAEAKQFIRKTPYLRVDFVFHIGVQTINGLDNRFGGQIMQQSANPEFVELLRALKTIQRCDGLGMRVKPKAEQSAVVMCFKSSNDEDLSDELTAVRRILRVPMITGNSMWFLARCPRVIVNWPPRPVPCYRSSPTSLSSEGCC